VSAVRGVSRRALASYEPLLLAPSDNRRPAAVLALLYEHDGEEHLLFQVRTQRVRHHKGEISFPGGGMDPEDGSPLLTALRETREEIGVAAEHIEVFGQLDEQFTRSGFAITPFVGAIAPPGRYDFALADREVAELLMIPVAHLRSEQALEWMVRDDDGERAAERSFRYGEHLVWGLTARILFNYFEVLAGAEAAEGASIVPLSS
jgi:8-oxo-dGTP pyrophosphatase MutT (NUDIX family)